MNNSITYKGDVNIKILHKNRVVKKIFESNTGEMSLFNFLVRCLSGEFNSDLLPYYIMLFNSSESVDFFPDNMNTLEQITFNPIYLASQPTINDNSVTFSFLIPKTAIDTTKSSSNLVALYNKNNINSDYAEPSAWIYLTSDNTITLDSQSNIVIAWTMTIENKQ